MQQEGRNKRKTKNGTVISSKMEKTIVVRVEGLIKHPIYGKVIKRGKNYMVHNENTEIKVGDKVTIEETRPLSKRKHWRVVAAQ